MTGRPNLSRGTQVSGANGDRKKKSWSADHGKDAAYDPTIINVLTSPLTGDSQKV